MLLVLVSFEFAYVQDYLPGVCNRSDGKKDVCYGAVRFSLASGNNVQLGINQFDRLPDLSFGHHLTPDGFGSEKTVYSIPWNRPVDQSGQDRLVLRVGVPVLRGSRRQKPNFRLKSASLKSVSPPR